MATKKGYQTALKDLIRDAQGLPAKRSHASAEQNTDAETEIGWEDASESDFDNDDELFAEQIAILTAQRIAAERSTTAEIENPRRRRALSRKTFQTMFHRIWASGGALSEN